MHRSRSPSPAAEAPQILVSLLSTRAVLNRSEKLRDPSSASAWLADQGLLPLDVEVTEAERRRLVELRERLYALLLAPRRLWTQEAARLLNRTLRDTSLEISVTQDRTVRIDSPDRSFDGAFGKIVSLVINGFFKDQWRRYKACANDECRKVFYDTSRNAARRWCDRRCGGRVRTRDHRRAVKRRR